jgi:5-methylcytosine-specific restriction endonuclease McrA
MPSSLKSLRSKAYSQQDGRCHYCGFLMWQSDPAEFAHTHALTLSQAHRFQCTAEHVVARQDGGLNAASNIVAACLFCNHTRHARKKPLPASAYKTFVTSRLQQSKWHPHAKI